jgi:hypothetical protein
VGLHGQPKVTNADRLEDILGLKKDVQTKFGQEYDLNRPEALRQWVMSGPEAQAILKQKWQELTPAQRELVIKEVVQAMPHPTNPTGLSTDAKKIFQVLKTGNLDEASQAAIASAESGLGTATTADAPTMRQRAGSAPVPSDQVAAPTMPDGESPVVSTAAPAGQYNMEAAEDIRRPTGSQRLPRPVGLDPKEKGLKDPTGGTSIEDRPPLRSPPSRVEMVDGRPIRVVDDEGGAIGREDMGAIRAGRDYEAAQDARAKFQLDLLVQTEGSQEAVADLFKRAGGGDEAAQGKIDAARRIASQQVQVPPKPRTTQDFAARKSETSPQAVFDQNVNSLAIGKPGASVYTPKAGQVDHAMEIWKSLATKFGKEKTPLGPQSVFDSPTQMAQFVIRNASPEMFDVMPVTPKQRALAELGAVMKDLPVNAEKGRIAEAVKEYSPDAPLSAGDRNVVTRQAIERLAKALEERFGSQWGKDFKPTRAGDTPAAPASTGGELGPGTTQDTSQIPGGGRISEPTDLSISDEEFARRMDEYESQTHSREYLKTRPSDVLDRRGSKQEQVSVDDSPIPYASKPSRPVTVDNTPNPDEAVVLDEKSGTVRSFEQMLKEEIDKMYTGIDEGIAKDVANGIDPKDALKTKPVGRSYGELDPEEQWKSGYATDPEETYLADGRARNPGTTPEQLARRDSWADEYSETMPQLSAGKVGDSALGSEGGYDRTSLILKRMDEVDAELQGLEVAFGSGQPENAMDIQKHNDLTAEKASLRDRLDIAQRIDSMTGVKSAKRPPLSGRINKGTKDALEAQTGDPLDFVEDDSAAVDTRPVPAATSADTTAKPKVSPWLRDGVKRANKVIKSLGAKKMTQAKLDSARAEYAEMKAFGDTLQGDAKTQWEQDVLMPLQQAGKAAKDRVAAPKAPAQPKPQPAAAATDPNVELAGTPDPVPDEAMEAARAADEAPPAEDLGAMPEEESADVVMGADDPVTYPPPAVVRQPIDPEVIDPLESSATPIGDEIIDAEFEVKAPRADSSPDAETKAADPEATTLTAKQDAAEAASNADASKATNDAESARPLKESEETDATAAKTGKRGGVLGALWRNKGIIGVGAAGLAGYQYLANQRVSEPLADGSPGGSPSGSPAGQAGGAFGGGMAGAGQDAGSGSALWSSSITPEQRIRMLRQMDGTANRKTPQTFYNWRGYE